MHLLKCTKCKRYTLGSTCPKCGAATASAHPARFSLELERRLGKYRRCTKL